MKTILEFEGREVRFRLVPESEAEKRLIHKMDDLRQISAEVHFDGNWPKSAENIREAVLTASPAPAVVPKER